MNSIHKTFQSKKGNTVVFRHPTMDDLNDMLAFANGLIEEDTYIELSGNLLTLEEERETLEKILKEMEEGTKLHIVVTVNGSYAGNAVIRKQNRRKSHVGEVGIALAASYREEGIGKELLRFLIGEAPKLGITLLVLNSFECNERALYVYEKLGFKKAGIIPGSIAYKGKHIGEVKMYLSLADVSS